MDGGSVDKPPRIPLVTVPGNRDDTTDKDARLVNGFVEKSEQGEYFVYKRPGLLVNTSVGASAGLGVYNWKNNIYAAFGTALYKNGVSIGTIAGSTQFAFSPILGVNELFFKNNTHGYITDGATVTELNVGSNYPSSQASPITTVPGLAYLDGTMYVMDANANIYGSAIDDVTSAASWSSLNKIVAQIEPDGGVALAKQITYVIAFKQWSTEVFYDAANATGSPLGTVPGAKQNWGCLSADSVQELDGTLLWAATNRSGAAIVMKMENLRADRISTKAVERLLDQADFTAVKSWSHMSNGHRFYMLTLTNSNLTLAYDLNENLWHQWTQHQTSGAENYMPIVCSTYGSGQTHILQHQSNGKLYNIDSEYFTDDGTQITVDLYSPNFDAGVRSRKKMLTRMTFIADQTQGATLKVRHNDADYDSRKWSNFRSVDLSQQLPYLLNCGSFRRRAWNIRHVDPSRLRLMAVEYQMEICTL